MVRDEDRTAALMAFGIMQIVLGLASAGMLALTAVSMQTQPYPLGTQLLAPMEMPFGLAAVLFIVLGAGSIGARRWARAISLVLSWLWLFGGIVATTGLLLLMGRSVLGASQHGLAHDPMVICSGGCVALIYVVVPLVFVRFYSSPHVKATCEERNPQPSWTDRVPLAVLGLSVWVLYGGISALVGAATVPVLPLFGSYLVGLPASLAMATIGLAQVYLSWAIYRLDRDAWWGAFVLSLALGVSHMVSIVLSGVEEFYRHMQMPADSITAIRGSGVFDGPAVLACWPTIVTTAVFLGYMLYVRKFFLQK